MAATDAWTELSEGRVAEVFRSFVGRMEQVPPQYSAKKVGGEAMHRRARRGEEVALAPVPVVIHCLEIESVALPSVTFRLRCSSGTYVRALARDAGARLGVGAHLTALRRTAIGSFRVEDALVVGELDDETAVARARLEPAEAMGHLSHVEVDEAAAGKLRHGQRISWSADVSAASDPPSGKGPAGREPGPGKPEPRLVAVTHLDELLAIADLERGVLKPRKVFAS